MAVEARTIGETLASQAGDPRAARGNCFIFQGMEGLHVWCRLLPGSESSYECTGMV